MTDVAAACAELATIAPLLGPALTRDRIGGGTFGRLEPALSLYNTDVLLARNRLMYEIPAAAIRSAELVSEPWPWRPVGTCLRALPRFATRMDNLGLTTEHRQLDLLARAWVLQAKRALGLRRPDVGPLAGCPRCDPPPGQLWMAGAEATLNPRDLTQPPKWEHDPRIYCTRDYRHSWPEPEWDHLIRVVNQREMA